jgi:hypothetical protein
LSDPEKLVSRGMVVQKVSVETPTVWKSDESPRFIESRMILRFQALGKLGRKTFVCDKFRRWWRCLTYP